MIKDLIVADCYSLDCFLVLLFLPGKGGIESHDNSKRFISFKRSLRNLVNELGFMSSSSGDMSRKYLKDISYLERSTTSTSDV